MACSLNTLKEEPLGMGEAINKTMYKQSAVQENVAHFFEKCCSPHAFYHHCRRFRGFPI